MVARELSSWSFSAQLRFRTIDQNFPRDRQISVFASRFRRTTSVVASSLRLCCNCHVCLLERLWGMTRWEKAFGREFLGPHYLLGQLGFVRTKDARKFKFSSDAEPAIFVGWRLDFGMGYRGVLQFVLYSHLREDASSYPVSQFHDTEVYMPAEAVFPLASAAEAAVPQKQHWRSWNQTQDAQGLCDLCTNAQDRRDCWLQGLQ